MDRTQGYGGTDIAAIIGVHPHKGPIDVFQEKLGLAPPIEDNEDMRWGRLKEPLILSEYGRRMGVEVERVTSGPAGDPGLVIHPKHSILYLHPDALAPKRETVIEAKATRHPDGWGEPMTAEVPEQHFCQVQPYMDAMDWDVSDIPVLIGSSDFRIYRVRRDREFLEHAIADVERFHKDHVLKRRPPPIDGSESAKAYLARIFPADRKPMKQATPDVAQLARELREYRERLEAAEIEVADRENRLKEFIGDAAGVEGTGFRITWKSVKRSGSTDWEKVARDLGVPIPADLIIKHSKESTSYRRFVAKYDGE